MVFSSDLEWSWNCHFSPQTRLGRHEIRRAKGANWCRFAQNELKKQKVAQNIFLTSFSESTQKNGSRTLVPLKSSANSGF